MKGKFTGQEKAILAVGFFFLLISMVVRGILGVQDRGILVILGFTAILLWLILFVCSLFPASWRMTEKQKAKIKDMEKYQSRYQKVFVFVDFAAAVLFGIVIFIIA